MLIPISSKIAALAQILAYKSESDPSYINTLKALKVLDSLPNNSIQFLKFVLQSLNAKSQGYSGIPKLHTLIRNAIFLTNNAISSIQQNSPNSKSIIQKILNTLKDLEPLISNAQSKPINKDLIFSNK